MDYYCYWYSIISYANGAKELIWLVYLMGFKMLHESNLGDSVSVFNTTQKGSVKSVPPVFILFSRPVWPDAQGLVCHCIGNRFFFRGPLPASGQCRV